MNNKTTSLLTSLGAGLEYYDFIIYGMMAPYIGELFFFESAPWLTLMKTFGVFAVGYLARPLGGLLFGMMGDYVGRKKALLLGMSLMAFSTFCIGLLPTYNQIGGTASFILILLRLLQGIAFGAELPGAITFITEHSASKNHGLQTGFVISSTGLGAAFASFVIFMLTYNFSQKTIYNGGWRIPFLFGGILALINLWIRKYVEETPEFLSQPKRPSSPLEPLQNFISHHFSSLFKGIGLTWLTASLVIFALYLPVFLQRFYSYTSQEIYGALTGGLLWSAIALPLCGKLSDRISKEKMLKFSSFAFILLAFPLFQLLKLQTFSALILFMFLYQTFVALLSTSYIPLLAALFPTSVRFTGIATCYNLTYTLAAFIPLLLTTLLEWSNSPYPAILVLISGGIIAQGVTYKPTPCPRILKVITPCDSINIENFSGKK